MSEFPSCHNEEPWGMIASVLSRRTLNWVPWIKKDVYNWSKEDLIKEFNLWLMSHKELTGAAEGDDPLEDDPVILGAQIHVKKYYEFHTGWKNLGSLAPLGLLRSRASKSYTEAHQAENDQFEKDYIAAKAALKRGDHEASV